MALRSEAVEVNLVRTSGLFRRPNFKTWPWSWASFGTASQTCRRAKQLCSASLLLAAMAVVLSAGTISLLRLMAWYCISKGQRLTANQTHITKRLSKKNDNEIVAVRPRQALSAFPRGWSNFWPRHLFVYLPTFWYVLQLTEKSITSFQNCNKKKKKNVTSEFDLLCRRMRKASSISALLFLGFVRSPSSKLRFNALRSYCDRTSPSSIKVPGPLSFSLSINSIWIMNL